MKQQKSPGLLGAGIGLVLVLLVLATIPRLMSREDDGPGDARVSIGMITNNPNGMRNVDGFRAGLRALGYRAGETATFLFSGQPTPNHALEQSIQDMIGQGADLIFTAGTPTGIAAWKASWESGVPVVFGVIADPIVAGVMSDLTRPGGNMTGVMLSNNQARRLDLLKDILPDIRTVWVPYDPTDAAPRSAIEQITPTAAALGLTLVHAHAEDSAGVRARLAEIPPETDAIFLLPDSRVNREVETILATAHTRGLPVSAPSAAQVEAGALMAYGIVHHEAGEQAAAIADRILRGRDPATMPVESAEFYLLINVAAAERIGLELPEEILQLADHILHDDGWGEATER
ncbi:ABC transporter substrate-binding protein [Tropicimonas sp. TH_r6]|uniref:ABC transporter substrate-binding protein n=1 Tax=Tropicimonas sp. TH_r6 TaxID=3082085 RepID=UPI002954F912|nr:ABC transporter substrate-binding protein [Tropicimonas sp. TH_r6]MDV7142706.1 ABC transporter substrate-binding protein [Tropicimonas sp. TH_r6]